MLGVVAITDHFTETYPSEVSWTSVLVLPAFIALVPFLLLMPTVDTLTHDFAYSHLPRMIIEICFIPWLGHILRTARCLLFSSDLTAISRLAAWLAILGMAFNAFIQIASGVTFDLGRLILGPVFSDKVLGYIIASIALAMMGACYGNWYLAKTIGKQRSFSIGSQIAASTFLFLASILPCASVFAVSFVAAFVPAVADTCRTVGYDFMLYVYYCGLSLSYLMTFGGLKLISAERQTSPESRKQSINPAKHKLGAGADRYPARTDSIPHPPSAGFPKVRPARRHRQDQLDHPAPN